ncbi:MAG TPA: YezD family protein [Candidatus Paceibacterota bacterium]|nr:YezD family protein [Candidatus Paceibacterota bacterium]
MNTKLEKPEFKAANQDWLDIVRQHVGSVRFGAVEIVVHESRVVQIERTERVRLEKTDGVPPRPN